jgi:gas vesicle protein
LRTDIHDKRLTTALRDLVHVCTHLFPHVRSAAIISATRGKSQTRRLQTSSWSVSNVTSDLSNFVSQSLSNSAKYVDSSTVNEATNIIGDSIGGTYGSIIKGWGNYGQWVAADIQKGDYKAAWFDTARYTFDAAKGVNSLYAKDAVDAIGDVYTNATSNGGSVTQGLVHFAETDGAYTLSNLAAVSAAGVAKDAVMVAADGTMGPVGGVLAGAATSLVTNLLTRGAVSTALSETPVKNAMKAGVNAVTTSISTLATDSLGASNVDAIGSAAASAGNAVSTGLSETYNALSDATDSGITDLKNEWSDVSSSLKSLL